MTTASLVFYLEMRLNGSHRRPAVACVPLTGAEQASILVDAGSAHPVARGDECVAGPLRRRTHRPLRREHLILGDHVREIQSRDAGMIFSCTCSRSRMTNIFTG